MTHCGVLLTTLARVTPHQFDALSESAPTDVPFASAPDLQVPFQTSINSSNPFELPLNYWDIYIYDFCGLAQGNKWTRRMVKGILFQALDKIFRPLDPSDVLACNEPAFFSKLEKGDATWATSKVMWGWLVDIIAKRLHFLLIESSACMLSLIPCSRPSVTWPRVFGITSLLSSVP